MIIFSIDTMPLNDNIIDSNDYSSKIIYSAVMDPLFKYNSQKRKYVKNSCKNFCYKLDNSILEIELRNDLFFSDGSNVKAIDYYKICKNLLKLNNHVGFLFREFFSDVKIKSDYILELTNLNKNDESYKILSVYNIGCIKKNNITSGPYFIDKKSKNCIILRRNKYYRKKSKNDAIKFIVTNGINDYKLFNENRVDITNNTLFDINNVEKYGYISEKNYIYMSLNFSPKLLSNKFKNLRKYIMYSIDRNRIVNILDNKFCSFNSFILNDNKVKIFNLNVLHGICSNEIFTLGYNDFYPNNIVAEELKKQLEQKGLEIKLVKNKFNTKNENDLNIVLNYLDFISEDAMIYFPYFRVLFNNTICNVLMSLYGRTHNRVILNIINNTLLRSCKKIPIIEMCGYYKKNSKLQKFNYIELNYEEL